MGPIFFREASVAPRKRSHFVIRTIYAGFLFLLMCTAWWIVVRTQLIRSVSQMAQFGSTLFGLLAPLQAVLLLFLASIRSASNVSVEKDQQTYTLLLMTRLSSGELVLGKLFASLLHVVVMLACALPVFALIVLFGGVSFEQVGLTFLVTALAILVAGAVGSTVALWRETTFQSLALTMLLMVFWVGIFDALALLKSVGPIDFSSVASAVSPLRVIVKISQAGPGDVLWATILPFVVFSISVFLGLNLLSIWKVRQWNPHRGTRRRVRMAETNGDASTHVDHRAAKVRRYGRRVWKNPVWWREVCTWAYGRRILLIRVIYWAAAMGIVVGLFRIGGSTGFDQFRSSDAFDVAPGVRPLAPFIFVSLLILNALAVSSITTERDGRSLDLLWMTDLTPKEFLMGKLFGVLMLGADVILWPMAMCLMLFWSGNLSLENLLYVLVGYLFVVVFAAVLGLHCGMIYANSQQSILTSLGTLFFLFLGVITSMVLMVSFTGNVEAQLPPFITCIVGGSLGLYAALGLHTRSPALALASIVLPIGMFVAITSFLMERFLTVFLVITGVYGFAVAAMIVPAVSEFYFAMTRVETRADR